MIFLPLGDETQNLDGVLNTDYDSNMKLHGTVRGLRRNNVYRPHIEVVTSIELNKNATLKVHKLVQQF